MSAKNSATESKISLEQVRHVATLARLELEPAEEQSLQANMSEILSYIDQLNQLDTSATLPTAQVGEAGTPMRDDVVTNHPAPEDMLANAPAREGHFFKVPKIIEG
jgi:aspartyl-tRNA(Asn)/glutamyl-tRNA(Gln) amidotransferase subunit C